MDYKDILKEDGNDVERTLNRFCGNEELYKKFLIIFFKKENPENIRELYKDKKYEELFMASHTYKGVTGNLGLQKLYEGFAKLDGKIRNEDYEGIGELIEEVLEKKLELQKKLEGLLIEKI